MDISMDRLYTFESLEEDYDALCQLYDASSFMYDILTSLKPERKATLEFPFDVSKNDLIIAKLQRQNDGNYKLNKTYSDSIQQKKYVEHFFTPKNVMNSLETIYPDLQSGSVDFKAEEVVVSYKAKDEESTLQGSYKIPYRDFNPDSSVMGILNSFAFEHTVLQGNTIDKATSKILEGCDIRTSILEGLADMDVDFRLWKGNTSKFKSNKLPQSVKSYIGILTASNKGIKDQLEKFLKSKSEHTFDDLYVRIQQLLGNARNGHID